MVNKLQIVRVDNTSVQKVDLRIGDNIIGRGAATGHVDNPIVENAVTIYLAPNGEMTLTPMLACYIKSGGSSRWRSLKVGCTVPVQSGDICSLLPYKSWFKIISTESNAMEDNDVNGKRKATNPSEEEPPDKKVRSDSSVETLYSQSKSVLDDWDEEGAVADEADNGAETNDISDEPATSRDIDSASAPNASPSVEVISVDTQSTTTNGNVAEATPANRSPTSEEKSNNPHASSPEGKEASGNCDEAGKKIKWNCGRHFSDQTDQRNNEAAPETGETSATTEASLAAATSEASALAPPNDPPRNKCTYGSQCYRRNSGHRATFSHPGDPDYDVPDDRPECPYGVRCYRKNPQHKRDFKHTKNRRTRAQTPVRARTPNATSGTEQSSADESVDESEYEPSLATSDDFESDFDKSDYDGVSDYDDK